MFIFSQVRSSGKSYNTSDCSGVDDSHIHFITNAVIHIVNGYIRGCNFS